ncbi:hypothetical protein [Embleya sp. MST-111070]|uniref:hypothetical protein n=1 Tax=Embleya sp. MST-111070 TaxID=3398231 RepID=UPI003F73481C
MNRDWETLDSDLRAADRVAAWGEQHPEFRGVRSPQGVVDRFSELHSLGDWHTHDLSLAVLLRRVAGSGYDGELAWRVAVRVLMPKAIRMAQSQLRPGRAWDDVFSTVLSALFEVVRTYPLQRRPRRIFVNLAMDTLALAQRTLAADFDNRSELRRLAASVAPVSGFRDRALVRADTSSAPHTQLALAELLARAAELELVGADEGELIEGSARTELLSLMTWAIEVGALTVSDARRISAYYLACPDTRTTRAMGADGARLRQRASRAVRPLRRVDLDAYRDAA